MADEEDDVIAMAMREAASQNDDDEDGSVDVGEVTTVAELVNKQIALEQELANLAIETTRVTAELEQVRTRDLPEKMLEMNVSSWTTTVGDRKLTVKLDRVFFPSIKKEDMPAFVDWLKKRGDEGIVTPKFVLGYEKGQVDQAETMYEQLKAAFPDAPVTYTPEIHWATLRSYTKDVATDGETKLPPFYKYHETNISKITSKKA